MYLELMLPGIWPAYPGSLETVDGSDVTCRSVLRKGCQSMLFFFLTHPHPLDCRCSISSILLCYTLHSLDAWFAVHASGVQCCCVLRKGYS